MNAKTLSHASHAEKFTPRITNMVMARIDGLHVKDPRVKLLPFVFAKCNDKIIHDTIGMTPAQATLTQFN
jgi:hypothetical protein